MSGSRKKPLPVPDAPPRAVDSTADLRQLQRFMAAALRRRLDADERTQRRWVDGRPTARVAATFMKANDRLSALERLEIYNRQYWFRLLDSFREDTPGLRALLGHERYWRLAEAYLEACPSRSFTLRDLCSRLPAFIRANPKLTAPNTAAALDLARFEWAQIVAFDGPSRPPVSAGMLASTPPEELRLGVQPYVTLLDLNHAADDYVIAVKQHDAALRTGASNAVVRRRGKTIRAAGPVLRKERVYLAVHRVDNQVYFKRLELPEFRLLRSLRAGRPLAQACVSAFHGDASGAAEQAQRIEAAFTLWRRLGWICEAEARSQIPEARSQKTEVGNRRTDSRGQGPEVGGRTSEVGSRIPDPRGQKSDVGSRKSEVGGRAAVRGRRLGRRL